MKVCVATTIPFGERQPRSDDPKFSSSIPTSEERKSQVIREDPDSCHLPELALVVLGSLKDPFDMRTP
jgi:hypothetical protein